MNNSSETLKDFLNALATFRKGMYDKKINMDKVMEGFVRFFYDKENDLYIAADKDNNATTILGPNGGEIMFIYTSMEKAIAATFDGKNADFLVNNAYVILKDIIKKDNVEGFYINYETTPRVYVPKDIIKKIVESVDMLNN